MWRSVEVVQGSAMLVQKNEGVVLREDESGGE